MHPTDSWLHSLCWWYLDMVMSNISYLLRVMEGCLFRRYNHCHNSIVVDLSFTDLGFDFSQGVVLISRVNWQAVRLDALWSNFSLSRYYWFIWMRNLIGLLEFMFLALEYKGDLMTVLSLIIFLGLYIGAIS